MFSSYTDKYVKIKDLVMDLASSCNDLCTDITRMTYHFSFHTIFLLDCDLKTEPDSHGEKGHMIVLCTLSECFVDL